jgi:hypothetical protein
MNKMVSTSDFDIFLFEKVDLEVKREPSSNPYHHC